MNKTIAEFRKEAISCHKQFIIKMLTLTDNFLSKFENSSDEAADHAFHVTLDLQSDIMFDYLNTLVPPEYWKIVLRYLLILTKGRDDR